MRGEERENNEQPPNAEMFNGLGEASAESLQERERRLVPPAEPPAEPTTRKPEKVDEAKLICETEFDLVKRARKLKLEGYVGFKDFKNTAGGPVVDSTTDENRTIAMDALFSGLPTAKRPHFDGFTGRVVDHEGKIIDDNLSMSIYLKACSAMGLKKQSLKGLRDFICEWALAKEQNDLIVKFKALVPKWDGKPRMRRKLITLFELADTPLNEEVGQYFWMSLFCRIRYPGCFAPIVIDFIGGQNAGKSHFQKRLCQILLQDKNADTVQYNLGEKENDILRRVTGKTIILSIGERAGWDRADINRVKAFVTRPVDYFNYKFLDDNEHPRQFISVMDDNKYDGLQKDDTGNRRFYPMFVGQLPDVDGQPRWRDDFVADFTGLESEVWQIMAEVREFLIQNGGRRFYDKFVSSVIPQVQQFNKRERDTNRGTGKDPLLERMFFELLKKCEALPHKSRTPDIPHGVKILYGDFHVKYAEIAKTDLNSGVLTQKIKQHGGEVRKLNGNKSFLFWPYYTIDEFKAALDDDSEGIELVRKEPPAF